MGEVALGKRRCPLCGESVEVDLRLHLLKVHGREGLRQVVIADKERGMSDVEIGERYGISFGVLEQMLTQTYGANVSVLKRPRRIKRWEPPCFREETTTVWSFERRGDWATHNGRYRGNWSPYIPRNIILRYSEPGDMVLDYFVGGGTTAIEAKLLGRRCMARDINPSAIDITRENLNFTLPPWFPGELYEPELRVGDARDLSDIADNSVDLICAHPPYAGIIRYSARIPGDLSDLPEQDFLTEMHKVARESLRVLKPGGKCAILIGDARRSRRIVPIGFSTIQVFLDAGFTLRELVIKRQHHCKTTGFWYARSIQYNFLLLAHEYLPVFEKPGARDVKEPQALWKHVLPCRATRAEIYEIAGENFETTTVWLFPEDRLEAEVRRNILKRFGVAGTEFVQIEFGGDPTPISLENARLLFLRSPKHVTEATFAGYRAALRGIVQRGEILPAGGFLAVEARDFRTVGGLVPAGLLLWKDMTDQKDFLLKEIVIVAPEGAGFKPAPSYADEEPLEIVHRYLLVYQKV